MNQLVIMVGLPGSGKSTYANEHFSQTHEILSSDSIRKELFGDESIQKNNSLVFSTLFERARKFLLQGKNVVIDATNVNPKDRSNVLDHFKDLKVERVAYVMKTPFEVCVERDSNRTRVVGELVINKFAKLYTKPTKLEGFNKIIYIIAEKR